MQSRMLDAGRRLVRLQELAGEGGYKALHKAGLVPFSDGSIRVGCCGRPCGGQEPGSRGAWLGRPLERSSPTEIVRQVARRDAVEAAHPALQPAVVGVHVLDVEGAVAHPNPGRDIDRL